MKYPVFAAILLCLAVCPGEARAGGQAPPGNPMLPQLAETGGAAEAGVELCGLDDDTAAAKRQQQELFIRMGGTREQFETAYRAGYDRAKSEYGAAGPAERKRMCDGFKALGGSTTGPG